MHRIDSSTKEVDKFGSGKHGFTEGDPSIAVPPTQTTDDFLNALQEEICNVIEGAGITLVKGTRTQLRDAVEVRDRLMVQNYQARTNDGAFGGTFYGVAQRNTGSAQSWCIVGTSGEIQFSSFGVVWVAQSAAGAYSGIFRGVGYNGSSLLCAVGSSGEIQTSPAGVTWTARTAAGAYGGQFRGIAHDQSGLWCAVGATGEIQTSADGTTWAARTAAGGYSGTFTAVAHNDSGLWCIVGSAGEIQTSADGTTWAARTPAGGFSDTFSAVVYNSSLGLWIICGDSGQIQTSPDGTTWTAQTSGYANSLGCLAVRGSFITIGTNHTSDFGYLISIDAITWYWIPSTTMDEEIYAIASGRDSIISVGGTGNIEQSLISAL